MILAVHLPSAWGDRGCANTKKETNSQSQHQVADSMVNQAIEKQHSKHNKFDAALEAENAKLKAQYKNACAELLQANTDLKKKVYNSEFFCSFTWGSFTRVRGD